MTTITRPKLAGVGTYPIEVGAPWAVNYVSADYGLAGLADELKAAPTRAGSALYLTHVTISIVSSAEHSYILDTDVSLVDAVGEVAFGPIQLQKDGGGIFQKDWPEDAPLKITDNKALNIVAGSDGSSYKSACLVYVEGFTGDVPIV